MLISPSSKEFDAWTVLELLLLLVLLVTCWQLWKYHRVLFAALKLPGISMSHGVFYILSNRHVEFSAIEVNRLKAVAATGLKTFCVWTGLYPIFAIADPDDIQTVLLSQKTNEKSFEYIFLKPFFGDHGIFLGKAEPHKLARRYLNPLFQHKNLNLLMPIYNQSGRILVNAFQKHIGKGHFDVRPLCNRISCRNVTGVMFGPDIDIDMDSDEFLNLSKFIDGIATVYITRFNSFWLWPDTIFEFLWKKKLNEYKELWRKFASGPLKKLKDNQGGQKKGSIGSAGIGGEELEDWTSLTFPAAYNVLREDHPEFTEGDFENEMVTLLVAGTDTTGIILSSLLLSLAAKPEIQEKLYQEIVSIVGMEDRAVTAQDFNQMQYLDQAFKETLRKYTVAPVIMRTVLEDIKLKECTIPAKSAIAVMLLGLHYDTSNHPDPEEFDPDRFSPENIANTKKNAFRPFSAGARDCIGAAYAGYLVKVIVIHILRRFRLTTTVDIKNLKFAIEVTKFVIKGYPVKVHERV